MAAGVDGFVVALKDLRIELPIAIWPPDRLKSGVQATLEQVRDIFRTGSTGLPITATGKLLTRIDDTSVEVSFNVVREGAISRIGLNRTDVENLGRFTEEGLTSAEVDLLMRRPAAAPRLFAIQRKASAAAKALAASRPGFPEDAYRHVLWSYMLAKAFGAQQALEVTDAHEQGENQKPESAADHAMDLNNNRVGVTYAESGISENYIADLVLTDESVADAGKVVLRQL